MKENKAISNVVASNRVAIVKRFRGEEWVRFMDTVKKVTKTQIVLNNHGRRFRRRDGEVIGEHNLYDFIRPAPPVEVTLMPIMPKP